MIYPYQKIAGDYYPLIKLSLIYKDTKLAIEALLDSGANISLFSADVAYILGVNLEIWQKDIFRRDRWKN